MSNRNPRLIPGALAVVGVAALIATGIGVATSDARGDVPTHEVPTWMRQTCPTEDSLNCYWPGGSIHPKRGEAYIRRVPGKAGMVCVFYVNRPRADYCQKGVAR